MRFKSLLKPASRGIVLAGAIVFSQITAAAVHDSVDSGALISKYCTSCHNSTDYAGGFDLESATAASDFVPPRNSCAAIVSGVPTLVTIEK